MVLLHSIVIGGTDAESLVQEINAILPHVQHPHLGAAVVCHSARQLITRPIWRANEARARIDLEERDLVCHRKCPIWGLT